MQIDHLYDKWYYLLIIIFAIIILVLLAKMIYEYCINKLIKNHDQSIPIFYYINLDKSIERRQRYEKRLSNYPYIQTKRIAAITPDNLSNYKIIKPPHCEHHSELEFACTISHLKAIFTAYKHIHSCTSNNQPTSHYALITEDDLTIINMPKWDKLVKSAPPDWEILQLQSLGPNAEKIYKQKRINWEKFTNNMWGTACYLINLQGMIAILEVCIPEYNHISNWNDIALINLHYNNTYCAADHLIYSITNTYTYTYPLFNVDGTDSTIHPSHLGVHLQTINMINDMTSSNE